MDSCRCGHFSGAASLNIFPSLDIMLMMASGIITYYLYRFARRSRKTDYNTHYRRVARKSKPADEPVSRDVVCQPRCSKDCRYERKKARHPDPPSRYRRGHLAVIRSPMASATSLAEPLTAVVSGLPKSTFLGCMAIIMTLHGKDFCR